MKVKDSTMDNKKFFGKFLAALLIGLISVAGTILLLSYEASARPMTKEVDLTIAKVGTPDPVTAGRALTYTLTITNNGPAEATSITVTDSLPAGVTYDSASPDCGNGGSTVTCTLNSLPISNAATLTIVVTVQSSVTGTLTNSATVTATTIDLNTSDNTVEVGTSVNAEVDLAVAKADDPDPVIAGTPLTYTLTITNHGPSDATAVVVTDNLPSDVTFGSATPSKGSYNDSTGVWAVDSLTNGSSATLALTVTVAPSTRGTITNHATISANETDTQPANDTVAEGTLVNAQADLAVAKADDPEPVIAGTPLTYTLTVTNYGPSDATAVVVTDTLPSDVTFGPATPSRGGSCQRADSTVTCALGLLTDGSNNTVTIVVTPTVSGTISNEAEVSASEPDDTPSNNTHAITTTVNPGADLSVTKSDWPDPVTAGTTLTYTLTVINHGPSDATDVAVTDTLPSGVTFGSATPSLRSYDDSTGVWTVDSLTNGSSATLTLTVTVAPSTRGTITNSAEVSANETDTQPDNNTIAEGTLVNAQADLAVAKVDDPDPVVAGTPLTYTLTITNYGPSDATTVVVTDTLPSGVTFGSATPSQGPYTSTTGVWTVGTMTRSHTATLTIHVTVKPSTKYTLYNVATISSNENDPTSNNNEAPANTQVHTEANLTITKSAPAIVDAGEPLTYTLTVTNSGPSDATAVVVTDTLDHHVSYTGAWPTPSGFYDGDPYWSLASLKPGDFSPITLRVRVDEPLPNNTILTNTAWLDADQIAPISATRQTTVHSSPVLTITKSDRDDPVDAGGILYYTIVITNSGNANATNVTVFETYDPRVTFDSAYPNPDPGSGNRLWTFPQVTTDNPRTINVILRVTSPLSVGTVLTNQVRLASDQTTPVTVTEATSVTSASELTILKFANHNPVRAGAELEYDIYCNNFGTAPAEAVVITETYDSRVTFVSASLTPTIGNNVWYIGNLPVGGIGHIKVTVRVATPLVNGTILTNRVTIDSRYTSPKTITETTTVSSAPDLTLNVTDRPDPVQAGAPLTYTLNYTNTGNADATYPVVTATFDSHASFASATPAPSGGTGQVRYWNVATIAGEGGYEQIVIHANVARPLTNGTQLQFQAQIGDAQGSLETAQAQTSVTSAPALSFDKSDGVSTVFAGNLLTYTLTYTNTGNENASNVTITDTLPDYVTYVGCEIETGDCHLIPPVGPDQVVFHISAITQTIGQARLIVRVNDPLPAAASFVINHASMAHSSLSMPLEVYDIDPIGTQPDLKITVDHKPEIFSPEKLMTYTVVYGNVGQHMDAENVIITTMRPTGTVYIGYDWHSSDGQTYTRTVDYLPAGSTGHTLTFTVKYSDQSECPQINALEFKTPFTIVGKGGTGRDANPGDNTAIAYVGVPDLVVADFDVEPWPLEANVPVTFTIVLENQGTGWALNPDVQMGKAGSSIDIFTSTVASCPWERYGDKGMWDYIPAIAPGARYTLVMTLTGGNSSRQRISFTEQDIRSMQGPYVKADSLGNYPYGLIPERNEMNNVVSPTDTWPYHIYLPLALRNRP
jgi:uncharacterized repeat protein (TIGR01451 family)